MSLDLSQFIPTFLEESFEGLEVMESGLLNLDTDDSEQINAIFRAAHSIKGGSGTFGFGNITDFTHVVETLLDEVRSGSREFTDPLRNLLLESVDCIRSLLEAARDGVECDDPQIVTVQERLQQALDGNEGGSSGAGTEESQTPSDVSQNISETDTSTENHEVGPSGWHIVFIPEPQMLMTGNEPVLMMSALGDLGEIEIEVKTDKLPPFSELNPEEVLLYWDVKLYSDCEQSAVQEVFEWVEDDCELHITPLSEIESKTVSESPDSDISTSDDVTESAIGGSDISQEIDAEQLSPQQTAPQQSVSQQVAPQENVSAQTSESPATAPEQKPEVKPEPKKTPAAQPRKAAAETGSIRVGIDKVDGLINRVGELVITQSMLGQVGSELMEVQHDSVERLHEGLAQLERNTRDLQEEVMRIRMLPISFVFNRFPRMVHDVSSKLGKKVELKLSGEQTELDKTVMEKIGDPLVHLVRNSLDHGLELPEERLAAGKPETGVVHLNAYHQGGHIIIEITDDGKGLNTQRIKEKAVENGLITSDQTLSEREIHELVFRAGFSTAAEVSDLSGRGVGMDVVRRNIESLGGHVSVKSEVGFGSTFTVSLPLTLAILDGQLVQVGDEVYIVPLVSVVESIQVSSAELSVVAGQGRLFFFREEYIPIVHLRQVFNFPALETPPEKSLMVVVEGGGQKTGIIIDDLQGQQQVVIKSLETNYKRVDGVSGATILGNGDVALILDITGLVKMGLDPEVSRVARRRNEELEKNAQEAVA